MPRKIHIRHTDEEDSEHWKKRKWINMNSDIVKWLVSIIVFAGFTLGMYKVRIQATVDKVELQACEMKAYNDRLYTDEKDIAVVKNDVKYIRDGVDRITRILDGGYIRK